MIRNLTWNAGNRTVHIWAYDRAKDAVTVEVSLEGTDLNPADLTVRTSCGSQSGAGCYDAAANCLVITAVDQGAPSKLIDVILK